jgi:hypothetical protein
MSARRRLGRAMLALIGVASVPAFGYEPHVNYMLQCMGCHGPDGSGEPGRVPAIKSTLVPFAALPEGRRYLVQVPGAAQSTLTDAQLAAVINWIAGNLSAVNSARFVPFTEAEVARYRRTPLVEVSATRARLLKQVRQPP